jgi:hypothetical protein
MHVYDHLLSYVCVCINICTHTYTRKTKKTQSYGRARMNAKKLCTCVFFFLLPSHSWWVCSNSFRHSFSQRKKRVCVCAWCCSCYTSSTAFYIKKTFVVHSTFLFLGPWLPVIRQCTTCYSTAFIYIKRGVVRSTFLFLGLLIRQCTYYCGIEKKTVCCA